MSGTMYHVSDRRIQTWSLEAHLVDHCNLRCANCCTLSPFLPKKAMPVEILARDLERAARALRPHVFKLTGGEPLLHPDIVSCLELAKAAAISEAIQVTTNGFLLRRAPPAFWELIDRLTLSLYSSAPLPSREVEWIRKTCEESRVLLTIKDVERFAVMDVRTRWKSEAERAALYDACWLKVRCHLLYEGFFYKCTRPPHLAQIRRDEGGAADDGVDLEGPDLAGRILSYLEDPEPLGTCWDCCGASGGFEEHVQSAR
jgi:organic radical activating enzyme